MKKIFSLLTFVLLLSGCSQSPTTILSPPLTPSPSASTENAPSPTSSDIPAPVVPLDLDSLPLEDLPVEPLPMDDLWWRNSCPEIYLLAEVPEADIALYAVNQNDGPYSQDPLFLRYGNSLQWLDQTSYSVRYTPALAWADFDDDGSNELAAVYCTAYGTGCFIQELHLYEWDGTGWRDHPYRSSDYEAQVRQGISYGYPAADGLFSLSLDSGTLTSPVHTAPIGLGFGEWAYFDVDSSGIWLRLHLCAYFEKSLPQIIGTYMANVVYDGENFSLSAPQMTDPE